MLLRHVVILLLLVFLIAGTSVVAQQPREAGKSPTGATAVGDASTPLHPIDVSGIALARPLGTNYERSWTPLPAERSVPANLPDFYRSLQFKRAPPFDSLVAVGRVNRTQVLRFSVYNPGDTTVRLWLFPGLYFSDIRLFRHTRGQLIPLPDIAPMDPPEIGYRLIEVQPHDSMNIVASMIMVRTHLNRVKPSLISQAFYSSFVSQMDNRNMDSKIFSYLFCGLLLMMVLFSLTTFFQNANPEFLYYSAYAFFLGGMLFMKAVYSYHSTWFGFFQEGYLDYILQSVGLIFYMLFMQKFLNTRLLHPFLHRFYNAGSAMLIISMLLFSWFHYGTSSYIWENRVENLTKIVLLIMILVFVIYSARHWKDRLLRYLFWGNLCLLLFSLLSFLLLTGNLVPPQLPMIFRTSLFYYEIGSFLELVFFLAGLNHKNKRQLVTQARERERLKADNQMKEYEKEIAVYKAQQQERQRISADMHDELGSGMTAIRLMSEIARNKMKDQTPVEIDKISHSADEVLNKMNAIIWSMNSGNDTLDNLVSYIRAYAIEYFEYTPIACRIQVPEEVPALELSGDRRRNLFLCVKETLNNALKHSQASEILISFRVTDGLVISIHDNGKGIDLEKLRQFGNGLKNISKRMTGIGGTYQIGNENGTLTVLTLPPEAMIYSEAE